MRCQNKTTTAALWQIHWKNTLNYQLYHSSLGAVIQVAAISAATQPFGPLQLTVTNQQFSRQFGQTAEAFEPSNPLSNRQTFSDISTYKLPILYCVHIYMCECVCVLLAKEKEGIIKLQPKVRQKSFLLVLRIGCTLHLYVACCFMFSAIAVCLLADRSFPGADKLFGINWIDLRWLKWFYAYCFIIFIAF